jgi:hypothetical protein
MIKRKEKKVKKRNMEEKKRKVNGMWEESRMEDKKYVMKNADNFILRERHIDHKGRQFSWIVKVPYAALIEYLYTEDDGKP